MGPMAGHSAFGLKTQTACPLKRRGGLSSRMTSDTADTAAGTRAARAKSNRRPKITLNDDETALVRLAAKAQNKKPAQFMRDAVLAASNAAISAPAPKAPAPATTTLQAEAGDPAATVRKKLFLTPAENVLLEKEAKAAKLLQRDYMRLAVVAALTQAPPPRRKAVMGKIELAHEISMIAFQLKKIGNNLNQMAKQANTGLVPITEREIYYFLSLHQRVLTMSSAALEKVLA